MNNRRARPNLQARRRHRSSKTPPNEIPLLVGSLCGNDLLCDPSANQRHFATFSPKQLWACAICDSLAPLGPAAVQLLGG